MASLISAIVSSVQARRTAPLMSPSSSLEDTRDARYAIGSLMPFLEDLLLGPEGR